MSFCAQAVPLSTLRAHRDTEPPQPPAGQIDRAECERKPAGAAGVLLGSGTARRVWKNLCDFLLRGAAAPQFDRGCLVVSLAGTAKGLLAQSGLGIAAHGILPGGSVSVGASDEAPAGPCAHPTLPESESVRQQAV